VSVGLAMMPWFPGDFMRETRGWSVTARGVYRELLDAQWDLGAVPADVEELRTLIGATSAEWAKGWAKCECKFPTGSDGQRRNPTLEEHLIKSARLAERHAQGAAKTNAKRYGERSGERTDSESLSETVSDRSALAQRDAQRSPPSPSPSSSPSPYHLNGKDLSAGKTPPSDEPGWFGEFKSLYPKRAGDAKWREAVRAGRARVAEGHNPGEFLDGARRYRDFCEITGKTATEFVMQASRFLGPGKPFLELWNAPATKADNRLRGNLSAAEEFMRRTEPTESAA
jgi:uncharacterized protein YdaU (DUF1376 family)